MPRNAAGVYSLPNPPRVPSTTIDSPDENVTRDDIGAELTNSLDRNGRGGMLAPFRIADGTVAAPGLAFLNDPDNGMYRIGGDNWALTVAGQKTLELAPGVVTLPAGVVLNVATLTVFQITVTSGSITAPNIGQPMTLFSPGPGLRIGNANIPVSVGNDGVSGYPAVGYNFNGAGAGVYSYHGPGADVAYALKFEGTGVSQGFRFFAAAAGLGGQIIPFANQARIAFVPTAVNIPVLIPAAAGNTVYYGVEGADAVIHTAVLAKGGAGTIAFNINGLDQVRVLAGGGPNVLTLTGGANPIISTTGGTVFIGTHLQMAGDAHILMSGANGQLELSAAAVPALTFAGDLDTGLNWLAADQFSARTGGVERMRWSNGGITSLISLNVSLGADLNLNGSAASNFARLSYSPAGSTSFTIDNAFDDANAEIRIRTRTLGATKNCLILTANVCTFGPRLQIALGTDQNQVVPHFQLNGNGYVGTHWTDLTAYYIGQDSTVRQLRMFSGGSSAVGVALTNGATAWANYSDERMKDIIGPIENAAVKVSSMRHIIGVLKADPDKRRRAMLIAQDVIKVLPEAVSVDAEGSLLLEYTSIIPLHGAAIAEHEARIRALEGKLQ